MNQFPFWFRIIFKILKNSAYYVSHHMVEQDGRVIFRSWFCDLTDFCQFIMLIQAKSLSKKMCFFLTSLIYCPELGKNISQAGCEGQDKKYLNIFFTLEYSVNIIFVICPVILLLLFSLLFVCLLINSLYFLE